LPGTVPRVIPQSGHVATARSREFQDSANHSDVSVAGVLENVPLFAGCSKRELKLVAKCAKQKSVPANTTLMTEDEAGDSMLVILAGGASVTKSGRKIAELKSGDVVGELGPLTRAPRNATVVAKTACDVAEISRKDLLKLIDNAPGFSRKLLEALANRVRDTDKKLVG
jgi:CRP-like cAMP-binding protein